MPTNEPAASGNGEDVKVCNACGQEKPLTDFFGPYTGARGRPVWKSPCRACMSARQAAQAAEPTKRDLAREQRLRDFPGAKTCTGCGQEKPLADFGKPVPKDRAHGRQRLAFSPRCLACQSAAVMARRARKVEVSP